MANSQIENRNLIFSETKDYTFAPNTGEVVLEKQGCIPLGVVEPGVWKGFVIKYFAYTPGRGVLTISDYAGTTHQLNVIWARFSEGGG